MKSSVPGKELTVKLERILDELGPYPHVPIDTKPKENKQGEKWMSANCECGAKIKVSEETIDYPGLPVCACGGEFELSQKGKKVDISLLFG
jgi:hypothetical protein